MADKRISQLVERTDIANNDVVPIVASGATTTNKATISSIQEFMQENLDLGVTSVGITLGSSGTDVSVTGSPITTSGNITINFPTASATNRGLLSSADWTTFNDKQPAGNYVTLDTAQTITAQKVFTTSGSSDSVIITHGSGSGFALDVIKAGNGEAIRVNKTSGSGNAMTVIGGDFEAPTIVKTGGTSSEFLKADGSVDSNSYVTLDTTQTITGWKTFTASGNYTTFTNNDFFQAEFSNGSSKLNLGSASNIGHIASNGDLRFNTNYPTDALNFPKLTIASNGQATFSVDAVINGVNVGRGSGNVVSNTRVGDGALNVNTTGSSNTAVGKLALLNNTTGSDNTSIGLDSMVSNTTGNNNAAFGSNALRSNNSSGNTGIGFYALYSNTTGSNNVGLGSYSLYSNTTATGNTATGYFSLYSNTTGGSNTATGYVALSANTTGNANTATGAYALENNTTGSNNTAVGQEALENNIVGDFNTAIGSQSLQQNTTGINNTAAGRIALRDNTTGSQNAAFGNLALYFNTTGSQNTGIGYSALGGITTGINNVAVGHIAGNLINSGTDNITSSNSVYLGQDTRASASGNTNEIVIGHEGRGNGSNTVTLGNDSITNTYLKGAVTLTGALNGTSATFSSSVNVIESNGSGFVRVGSSSGRSQYQNINFGGVTGGTDYGWQLGRSPQTGGVVNDGFYIYDLKTNNAPFVIALGGNVGIGTASPTLENYGTELTLSRTSGGEEEVFFNLQGSRGTDGNIGNINFWNGTNKIAIINTFRTGADNSGALSFTTNNAGTPAERMRITSGGFLKASNTGSYINSGGSYHEINSDQTTYALYIKATNASPYGTIIDYSSIPNNTGNEYIYCTDNSFTTLRFSVRSNGGIANYAANNVILSDERVKKDIQPLESYWDKFKEIEIVKYKYKDQSHDDFNIGVIAQQVEKVAPEFVDIDGWGKPELDEEGNEIVSEEEPLKSIYDSDLHHATIKVLQEAMAKIEKLETEIDSLKNQIK